MSDAVKILLGAVAGATAAGIVWYFARINLDKSLTAGAEQLAAELGTGHAEMTRRLAAGERQLTTQLQAQIDTQVPPVVQRTIDATFRRYGITPDTGRRIDRALALAERVGVL